RQIDVFRCHPHLAVMVVAKRRGHVVDIGHRAHVDPGLWHRDDDVGETETKALDEHDTLVCVRDHLANEILACDSEVYGACRELARNLRRRQIRHFDIVETRDCAAVIACAPRLDECETGTREERLRVLLQAPFGRNGEDQRRIHDSPPYTASRSIQTANPTAAMDSGAPRRASKSS